MIEAIFSGRSLPQQCLQISFEKNAFLTSGLPTKYFPHLNYGLTGIRVSANFKGAPELETMRFNSLICRELWKAGLLPMREKEV